MLTNRLLNNSGMGAAYVNEGGGDISVVQKLLDCFSLRHEIIVMSAVTAEITR